MKLTEKYRPKTLNNIIGNTEIISTIKKMVNTNHLMSFVLMGSPATGKTSIATALANDAGMKIHFMNAVNISKKEIEQNTKEANTQNPIVIYIDEIHRLTQPNQEYFLPLIENGSVVLIGSTTESVYHKLTKALRSRMAIFELNELNVKEKKEILTNIIDLENIDIQDDAIDFLTSLEDSRIMINSLEFAMSASNRPITKNDVNQLGKNHISGDQNGSFHYSMKSAFQKSIRGSDLDAALYYLSRILKAGDLDSAIRRLRIIAFEDIGLGDTEAVIFTENAINIAEKVGLPEARIPMALATAKLCLAQKDNSIYKAYNSIESIPDYNAPININTEHPKTYIYPHDYENHIVKQQYLPDELLRTSFFEDNKLPGKYQNIYYNIKKIIGLPLRKEVTK